MTVDSMQVGGTHYESTYQHWNLVIAVGMQYLEAQATRYIARWRKKGGTEDLKKALHYTNKLLEVLPKVVSWRGERLVGREYARDEALSFCNINKLTPLESNIVIGLSIWKCEADVVDARDSILMLMDDADEQPELKPVPATDSNKHAIDAWDKVIEGLVADEV